MNARAVMAKVYSSKLAAHELDTCRSLRDGVKVYYGCLFEMNSTVVLVSQVEGRKSHKLVAGFELLRCTKVNHLVKASSFSTAGACGCSRDDDNVRVSTRGLRFRDGREHYR